MIKRKVLILGGAGYLGHHISGRFKTKNKFVVTVGDVIEPLDSTILFSKVNVFDKSKVDALIKDHDVIINCTGQITYPINSCLRINTEGIANIRDSVIKHQKKLYQISTVAVYGTNDYVDEQSELNPESPYSACKAFAEFQVAEIQSKKPCILRLPNLYGENQPKGLLAYLTRSFTTNKKLQFNNNGSLSRYLLHISDCSEGIFLAVENDLSGIFNVTATDRYSVRQIIEMIETIKSMKFEVEYAPVPPTENINEISFKAFTKAVGFLPKLNIRTFINNSFPQQ